MLGCKFVHFNKGPHVTWMDNFSLNGNTQNFSWNLWVDLQYTIENMHMEWNMFINIRMFLFRMKAKPIQGR